MSALVPPCFSDCLSHLLCLVYDPQLSRLSSADCRTQDAYPLTCEVRKQAKKLSIQLYVVQDAVLWELQTYRQPLFSTVSVLGLCDVFLPLAPEA